MSRISAELRMQLVRRFTESNDKAADIVKYAKEEFEVEIAESYLYKLVSRVKNKTPFSDTRGRPKKLAIDQEIEIVRRFTELNDTAADIVKYAKEEFEVEINEKHIYALVSRVKRLKSITQLPDNAQNQESLEQTSELTKLISPETRQPASEPIADDCGHNFDPDIFGSITDIWNVAEAQMLAAPKPDQYLARKRKPIYPSTTLKKSSIALSATYSKLRSTPIPLNFPLKTSCPYEIHDDFDEDIVTWEDVQ